MQTQLTQTTLFSHLGLLVISINRIIDRTGPSSWIAVMGYLRDVHCFTRRNVSAMGYAIILPRTLDSVHGFWPLRGLQFVCNMTALRQLS